MEPAIVVVVDDDEEMRVYLAGILQMQDFQVRTASNAIEALMMIQREKPIALIVDFGIPEVAGDEFCRVIKEDPKTKEIRIFVMTEGTQLQAQVASESGADECIQKPVDAGLLIQRLQALLTFRNLPSVPTAVNVPSKPSFQSSVFLDMVLNLYQQNESGVLKVNWAGMEKKFLIRNGESIFFESTLQGENIWHVICQRKKIQKPEIAGVFSAWLEHFIVNGLVSLEDFRKFQAEIMKMALMSITLWPTAEAEFFPCSVSEPTMGAVPLADVVLDFYRSVLDFNDIRKQLPEQFHFFAAPHFLQIIAKLNLKPEESFLITRIDGSQPLTVEMLQTLTGLPDDKIMRTVSALRKLNALEFKVDQARAAAKASGPARAPAKPAEIKPGTPRPSKLDEMVVRMGVLKSEKRVELESHVKLAEEMYRIATLKMLEGDFWKVTELCREAMKHNPNESKYYHLMAVAFSNHPRFLKDAEQYFHKAMEMDPYNPDYCIDAAKFFAKQGLFLRAMTECKKALDIASDHPEAIELFADLKKKQR